jgi:hypothetical protein
MIFERTNTLTEFLTVTSNQTNNKNNNEKTINRNDRQWWRKMRLIAALWPVKPAIIIIHGPYDYYDRYFCRCCVVFGPKSGLSWLVNHLLTIIINDVTMMGLIADFPSVSDRTNATMSCSYRITRCHGWIGHCQCLIVMEKPSSSTSLFFEFCCRFSRWRSWNCDMVT